jgi:hypothetical protein
MFDLCCRSEQQMHACWTLAYGAKPADCCWKLLPILAGPAAPSMLPTAFVDKLLLP